MSWRLIISSPVSINQSVIMRLSHERLHVIGYSRLHLTASGFRRTETGPSDKCELMQ